jgi:hypothetical protein
MGLDIYYYDKDNKEYFLAEISKKLHNQIFYKNVSSEEWGILSKIKHYYGIEVNLNRDQIIEFIERLEAIKSNIPEEFTNEIDELKSVLNNKEYRNITIAGD